jgi:hypothetical protein
VSGYALPLVEKLIDENAGGLARFPHTDDRSGWNESLQS